MTFYRYDHETELLVECGGKIVRCATTDCGNLDVAIEVADEPGVRVLCGVCGATL